MRSLNSADRLPGLDLLRSVAVVWVMLFHSFLLGGLGPDWSWLSRHGWMGVDLFFVLSGFLIGAQVLEPLVRGHRLAFGDFYLRRALRILPAYWTVLLLYLLWPAFREAPAMEPWWKYAAFTLNLSVDYGRNAAFSHAWSLCVEEHFYWLFPLLAVALPRQPSFRTFVALAAGVVLGGMALRGAAWIHGMQTDPGMTRNWFVEDIYYPTWNRLDGLLCGVALATWKTLRPDAWSRARRHADASLLGGVVLLGCSFALFQNRTGFVANTVGWPVLSCALGLLVFGAAGRDSVIGRRSVPFAGWIAAASYSLYLTHKAAYHLVQTLWGAWLADRGLVAFVAYGAGALLAGAALHLAVERPALRVRQRLAGPAAAAAPARPAS